MVACPGMTMQNAAGLKAPRVPLAMRLRNPLHLRIAHAAGQDQPVSLPAMVGLMEITSLARDAISMPVAPMKF